MKKSTVFTILEAIVAIAALAFFILLLIPGIGVGYTISSLAGQYGQTLYIVSVVCCAAIFVGIVILLLTTRDIIKRKRK